MLRKLSGQTLLVLGAVALVVLGVVAVAAYLAASWAVSFLSWPGVITLLAVEAVVAWGAVMDYREAQLEPTTRFAAWLLAHYTVVRRGYRRARWWHAGVKARRRARRDRAAVAAARQALAEEATLADRDAA